MWLDEFFGNCSDVVAECDPSLIKYLAFHDYHGHAGNIIRKAELAVQRYGGRKVWITEFAVGYGKNRTEQDKFMRVALPMLEASNAIHRYAWFSSWNKPSSWVAESSLLPFDTNSTQLESTGRIYAGLSTATPVSTATQPAGPLPEPPVPSISSGLRSTNVFWRGQQAKDGTVYPCVRIPSITAGRTAISLSRLDTAHGVAIRSRHHAAFSSRAAVFE